MTFMNFIAFLCLTYASLAFGAQRCGRDKFSCTYNDPCSPLCVAGQNKYPGNWPTKWVQCDNQGGCSEHRCPPKSYYNAVNELCEDKNGIEARCALSHNDCDQRNPCSPTLCISGVNNYPGNWRNRYVSCDASGGCSVIRCPRRQVWDQTTQQCIPKTAIQPPATTPPSPPTTTPPSPPTTTPPSPPTTTPPSPPMTTPPAADTRCDGPHFDCTNNDPCSPTKCTNNFYYPMVDSRDFINCDSGTCEKSSCPQMGNDAHFFYDRQSCGPV